MKLKAKIFSVFIVVALFLNSCFKEPIDYSKEINELKTEVTALKKRSDSINNVLQIRADSLANALKITNNNLTTVSKTVDSIRTQLTLINNQLVQLNTQLNGINVNISLISSQISSLSQQYNSLLEQLNAILAQLAGGMPTTLNTGLIAFYPFTGNAIDSSGNNNNGTVIGASLTMDRFGKLNSAYYFNGSSYIKANAISFSDISFSIWYSIDPTTNLYPSFGHPPSGGQILGQGTSVIPTNYSDFSLGISKIGNALPNYAIERGNKATFEMYYSSTQIQFSQWKNVIVVISNNILKLYENGVLINSYFLANPFIRNASILSIGSRYVQNAAVPPCNFFIGMIDDVRIYNRILTQDEISYLASH